MHQIENQMEDLSGKLVSEMQRTESHIIKRMKKVRLSFRSPFLLSLSGKGGTECKSNQGFTRTVQYWSEIN